MNYGIKVAPRILRPYVVAPFYMKGGLMNYFCPKTNYYIIPILDITNGHILHDGKDLRGHVLNHFPLLVALDSRRADFLYGERKYPLTPNHATEEYTAYCKLMKAALEYLNLPEHLLVIGNDFEVVEPATQNHLYNGSSDFSVLSSKRVSDCSLMDYYIEDYPVKVDNFFYPSEFTKEKSHLGSDEFIKELCKTDMIDSTTKRFFGYGEGNKIKGKNRRD